MRAPVDTIAAPLFPTKASWVNVPGGRGAQASVLQRGRPMLVEFWDFCRPNSLRTLPYLKAWHGRYAAEGLRVIGVHSPGFEPSREEVAVREAVRRLGIEYPVLIDSELVVWREYENVGWPARYLFDGRARLFEYHYGEGAYAETELAIQELLGVASEPLAPLRPEDQPGALLAPQTEDQPGAYSGPYEAGGVWAVLEGTGRVRVRTRALAAARSPESALDPPSPGDLPAPAIEKALDPSPERVLELVISHPGAYLLVEHERHTAGVLQLELDPGVRCHATCFTPGLA